MGNIRELTIIEAIKTGLKNFNDCRAIYRDDNGSQITTNGGNPQSRNITTLLPPDGNGNIPGSSDVLGTFQADGSGTIGATEIQVKQSFGFGFQELFTVDSSTPGSGMPSSYEDGATVTINAGHMDFGSQGVGDAVYNGINNASGTEQYKYQLRNGSGTLLKTVTPSSGAHVNIEYNGGFQIKNTLTFTNNGTSPWNAEQIEVVEDSTDALLFEASNFSADVPVNGKLNFTTLKLELTF